MRRNIQLGMAGGYAEALDREAAGQHIAGGTSDALEGGVAFSQKRKAVFRAADHFNTSTSLAQHDIPNVTLLTAALVEGGAEFLGELISGGVGNAQLAGLVCGREREIETRFFAQKDDTDLSQWLWNRPGTSERPGDLAFWVGYRIVKSYYQQSTDKRATVRDIVQMADPKAFLCQSGWRPGSGPVLGPYVPGEPQIPDRLAGCP